MTRDPLLRGLGELELAELFDAGMDELARIDDEVERELENYIATDRRRGWVLGKPPRHGEDLEAA